MQESERLIFRPYILEVLDFYASLWSNPEVDRYSGKGITKRMRGKNKYGKIGCFLCIKRDWVKIRCNGHKSKQ